MKTLIDTNEFHDDDIRLMRSLKKRESLDEYHEVMKWALQTLYFDGNEWIKICRIDNFIHEEQKGSHIHIYKRGQVKRIKLTYQQAEKLIKKISERILKDYFKKIIKFYE